MSRCAPSPPSSPELRRAMHTALRRALRAPKLRTRSMDDIMSSTRPIDAPPPVARAREAVVYDAVRCEDCGSGDREDELLLCDGCDRGHHTFCLRPICVEVPSGQWFCPDCAAPPAKPLEGGIGESNESERAFQHVPSNPSTNGDVTTGNASTSSNISKPTKMIKICPDCSPPVKSLEGAMDESDESQRAFQHVPSNLSTHGGVKDDASTSYKISKPTDKTTGICNIDEDNVARQQTGSNNVVLPFCKISGKDHVPPAIQERSLNPLPCPPPFNTSECHKPKTIKINEETKVAYTEYVCQRILKKGFKEFDQPPPFVQIAGFYVSYDEFYESLKPRGKIHNSVMTLWTYQFNHDEADAWADDNSIMKKYAFSSAATNKLIVEPAKFIPESCARTLKRLNNKWNLSKMDLLFFPIVHKDHWALTCINVSLKQTLWFNSVNASTKTPCIDAASNLINNFSKAAMQLGILKEDVSQYRWIYPTYYPQQNNIYDCGLYIMLYMESWNGKKMDVTFEQCTGAEYRKVVAGMLLLSPRNEIAIAEFVAKYCNK